ncbi:MAG: hypothetical protein KatS3mg011_1985 [Acidimicrobiia bacterium]|nr:MAG: hypothetical protein KatS3mg011_1985 [Acidimicrobiia bacterium]
MRGVPSRIRSAVFVVYLLFTVLVPLLMLFSPHKPSPFGWQMFSYRATSPDFEVVMADGRRRPLHLSEVALPGRGDVDYAVVVPPHVCRTMDVVEVVVVLGEERRVWHCG